MFCPSGHCLCRTVRSESTRIWNDLQDAETLNSLIHEDTITQTFALTLNRQHSDQSRVHVFNRTVEARNGSDFLWFSIDSNRDRFFLAAVQAKRLYRSGKYDAFKKRQVMDIIRYTN